MSVIQTHAQTQLEPAEFTFTNPDWCVTCGEEHDLDDGEDHKRPFGIHVADIYDVVQLIDESDLDALAFFSLQNVGQAVQDVHGAGFE